MQIDARGLDAKFDGTQAQQFNWLLTGEGHSAFPTSVWGRYDPVTPYLTLSRFNDEITGDLGFIIQGHGVAIHITPTGWFLEDTTGG